MKTTCAEARSWVPRALMSDLAPSEEQALSEHLKQCEVCAEEHRLYLDTLSQVRMLSDSPLPRHFFVYPADRGLTVMEFLRGLNPAWKLASSLAILTLAILAILAVAVAGRFQFRVEGGVYSFSFGRPLPSSVATAAPQIEALKAELTGLLQARSHAERAEWISLLRSEIRESNRYSARQQQRWNVALTSLEARLNDRIEGSAVTLTAGMRQSANEVFRVLQRQRQDMELTRTRLENLATRGELKNQETDEILSTLLQVARLTEQ